MGNWRDGGTKTTKHGHTTCLSPRPQRRSKSTDFLTGRNQLMTSKPLNKGKSNALLLFPRSASFSWCGYSAGRHRVSSELRKLEMLTPSSQNQNQNRNRHARPGRSPTLRAAAGPTHRPQSDLMGLRDPTPADTLRVQNSKSTSRRSPTSGGQRVTGSEHGNRGQTRSEVGPCSSPSRLLCRQARR